MDFDGFDWDQANTAKCQKHGLTAEVIEDLFSRPVAILPDEAHSEAELRFKAIGRTASGRAVFLVHATPAERSSDQANKREVHAREGGSKL